MADEDPRECRTNWDSAAVPFLAWLGFRKASVPRKPAIWFLAPTGVRVRIECIPDEARVQIELGGGMRIN